MFAPWCTAAVLLAGGWIAGWLGGSFRPEIPVLVHIVYFAVLSVPRKVRDGEVAYWVMGGLSVLAFTWPLVGGGLMILALALAGISRFADWWVTPTMSVFLCKDPHFAREIPTHISPHEYFRLRKLYRKRQAEART